MQIQVGLDADLDDDLKNAVDAPLRTAPSTKERPLSSRVPDKYIRQLKSFFYTDPTSGDSQVGVGTAGRVPNRVVGTS